MRHPAVYRAVRLANTVVFTAAASLALDLRALDAHADGPDHGAVLDLRVGPLCF